MQRDTGVVAEGNDRALDLLEGHILRDRLKLAGLAVLVIAGIAFAGAMLPDAPEMVPPASVARAAEAVPAARAALPIGLRPELLAAGWMPVRKPVSIYNLEGPETEGAEFTHRVFAQGRHVRRDILAWIAPGDPPGRMTRPAIRMIIERYENAAPTHRPLYADIALRAAEANIAVARMNRAQEILTKFGAFEAADAALETENGVLACLVFRRIDTAGLTIAGWYCGTAKRPADRVSLTCFVNRLDLMSAGQDTALRRFFAAAERNRAGCAGSRQPGRKLTWLDHEAPLPALKLSLNQKR